MMMAPKTRWIGSGQVAIHSFVPNYLSDSREAGIIYWCCKAGKLHQLPPEPWDAELWVYLYNHVGREGPSQDGSEKWVCATTTTAPIRITT